MAKQILKSVLIGILVGAALFMAPFFLLKFFLFFLIIGAICRLWWGGKRGKHRWRYANHWTNPDNIRNMSDEEYKNYKEKWNGYNCGPQHYYGCGNHYNNDCNDWRNPKNGPSKNTEGKSENNESSTDKTE
jgi:hypothetical protein